MKKQIRVVVKNKPTQQEAKKRIEELNKFLSETYHISINKNNQKPL